MDARIKALWIDALESGEYNQTVGRLRLTDALTGEYRYCCLGVLCDLYSKETGEPWEERGGMHRSTSFPPPEVAEWAGLTYVQRYGAFGEELSEDVAWMNDDSGSSFAEIAAVIRKNA